MPPRLVSLLLSFCRLSRATSRVVPAFGGADRRPDARCRWSWETLEPISRLELETASRSESASKGSRCTTASRAQSSSALALRGERQNGAVRWTPIVRALARREVEPGFVDPRSRPRFAQTCECQRSRKPITLVFGVRTHRARAQSAPHRLRVPSERPQVQEVGERRCSQFLSERARPTLAVERWRRRFERRLLSRLGSSSAGYQQLPNPRHWRAAPPIPALSPLREAFFDAMVFLTPNAAGLAASARPGAAVTCVTLLGVPNAPVAANLVPWRGVAGRNARCWRQLRCTARRFFPSRCGPAATRRLSCRRGGPRW